MSEQLTFTQEQPKEEFKPGMTDNRVGGEVISISLHDTETGFCILRCKVLGASKPVTVLGNLPMVTEGQAVEAFGAWNNHPVHGRQFVSREMQVVPPISEFGVKKFLGSIPGIGPHYSEKLVKSFGVRVLEILNERPSQIKALKGIGEKRYNNLVEGYEEFRGIEQIMSFLFEHGLGTKRATDLYNKYKEKAILLLSEDPYRISIEVPGFGFKLADKLAEKLNIPKDSLIRAKAGVRYVLKELCARQGHCAVDRKALMKELCDENMGQSKDLIIGLGLPEDVAAEAIQTAIDEGDVVKDRIDGIPALYPKGLFHAEIDTAKHLRRIASGQIPWPINAEKALCWVKQQTGLTYGAQQQEAIQKALSNKVTVITGGPGTGKSTIVNAIVKIYGAKTRKIMLCAPTGKAAKRLAEVTGLDGKTMHRALGRNPEDFRKFLHDENNPLNVDVVVLDETSMQDITISAKFFAAIPSHAVLIIVGDVDQLPSVGPGAVLADIIGSAAFPVTRLDEIYRQAKASQIIVNAHQINHGTYKAAATPKGQDTDFFFIDIKDTDGTGERLNPPVVAEKIKSTIVDVVTNKLGPAFGIDPLKDVQILTPMTIGPIGTEMLNTELQSILNPGPGPQIQRNGTIFRVGDRVLQTRNDYDLGDGGIFNGDQGVIERVNFDDKELTIRFDDQIVTYPFSSAQNLMLAYAMTIHRSQGSEYPCTIIPISSYHSKMLQRNLVYTAVTRGKRLVILVGQKRSMGLAVANINYIERLTNLKARLRYDQ